MAACAETDENMQRRQTILKRRWRNRKIITVSGFEMTLKKKQLATEDTEFTEKETRGCHGLFLYSNFILKNSAIHESHKKHENIQKHIAILLATHPVNC
jgi:hypothetical protein